MSLVTIAAEKNADKQVKTKRQRSQANDSVALARHVLCTACTQTHAKQDAIDVWARLEVG